MKTEEQNFRTREMRTEMSLKTQERFPWEKKKKNYIYKLKCYSFSLLGYKYFDVLQAC